MEGPRSDKAAVVEDVRERLLSSSAVILTEYRGMTVAELAALRQALIAAGGHYKVFKNTLVRRAVHGGRWEGLEGALTGPTAIAFVDGDVGAVAKALVGFARENPNLALKQGAIEGRLLEPAELRAIAELPSREVLLACLAGGLAAPLRQLAGLLNALPQNFAYGLRALVDARGAGEE